MKDLYVPMLVEAFVRGNLKSEDTRVPQDATDYSKAFFESFLGSTNTSKPFNLNKDPLECGVHLHFILPRAFTQADENNIYPAVPNRFLITRMALLPDGSLTCKRFVVESDFVSEKGDGVGQTTIPMFSKKTMFRWLGRCYPEERQAQAQGEYLDKLTAIGPGDPAFAAYYPNCRSVFGFYDSLDGLPVNTNMAYCVIGCFKDGTSDPFHGISGEEQFIEALRKHGFSVRDTKDICNKTVVFGVVSGIVWKGGDHIYDMGIPVGEINVSAGNTSAEALSVILANKLADSGYDERFITALQYGLEDEENERDGNFKIDDLIHTQGFTAFENLSGGIDLPEQIDGEGIGREYSDLLKLMERQGQAVAELKHERKKLFCLWEQYMFLYEKKSKEKKEPSADALKLEMAGTISNIKAMEKHVFQLEKTVNMTTDALAAKLPDTTKFKISGGDSFYQPKEPVILLSGNGVRRSYAFGEDGRFTSDGTLLCQTEPVIPNISGNRLSDCLGGNPSHLNFPISAESYGKLLVQAAMLCTDIKKQLEKILGAIHFQGEFSPVLLNHQPQSFTTLFMDWSVRFYPTRTSLGGETDNTLDGWKLVYGNTSYATDLPRSKERNIIYTGRTVITPQAAYNLKSIYTKWLEKHLAPKNGSEGADKEVITAAEKLDELPVLSQTLGGLNEQLIATSQALQFPIMGSPADRELAREVQDNIGEETISCIPSAELFSVRGGHFRVDKLNLIGSFGQVQRVIVPASPGASMKKIYYAETLKSSDPDYGLLTPGFVAPARLAFKWIHNADDSCISSSQRETTPVCGFIIPELLNRRLIVYGNTGGFIGILKTVYRNGIKQARWSSAPGLAPDPDNLEIDNTLKAFIVAMLSGDRLDGLMNLVDVNYGKTLQSGAVTIIWGRPLALARASLQLMIQGRPAYTMSYKDFGKYNTQGLENIRLPLHFGDVFRVSDGVTAVFPDETDSSGIRKRTFEKIYPSWGTKPFTSAGVCFDTCPDISCSDGESFFTLLMEVGNAVTLQTGILPVKSVLLPSEHIKAVENLEVAAELTCVLTSKDKAQLPILPAGKVGVYNWCIPEMGGERTVLEVVPVIADFEERYLCDGLLIKAADELMIEAAKESGNVK